MKRKPCFIALLLCLAIAQASYAQPTMVFWLGQRQNLFLTNPAEAKKIFSGLGVGIVTLGSGCCGDKVSTNPANLDRAVENLNRAGAKVNLVMAHLEMDEQIKKFLPVDEFGKSISRGCPACDLPFDIFNPSVRKAYLQVVENLTRRYGNDGRVSGFTLFGPGPMIEWEYYFSNWKDPKFPAYSSSAQNRFRRYLQGKYPDLPRVNARWGTIFASWDEIPVPRPLAKFQEGSFDLRPEWSDFVDWYQSELLLFLEETLQTARKNTGKPVLVLFASTYGFLQGRAGVSWGKIVKAISKYNPVAIKSNGTEKMITAYARKITSFYRVGLWLESPQIKSMEVIDSLVGDASGFNVDFIHVNSLTSLLELFGEDLPAMKNHILLVKPVARQTRNVVFLHNATAGFLQFQKDHGVLDYQNIDLIASYASGPLWKNTLNIGQYLGLPDVLDETLVNDGALNAYGTLIIPNRYPFILTTDTMDKILLWVRQGGTLIYVNKGYVLDEAAMRLIDADDFVAPYAVDPAGVIKLSKLEDIKAIFK